MVKTNAIMALFYVLYISRLQQQIDYSLLIHNDTLTTSIVLWYQIKRAASYPDGEFVESSVTDFYNVLWKY